MALTAADLKFFAAATQTDAAEGGGIRSSTLIQNGLENNLFPDVSLADRLAGVVRMRKAYPSLTNADTAPLLGGAVSLNEMPSDAATSIALLPFGTASTTRSQALAGALLVGGALQSTAAYSGTAGTATSGSAVVTGLTFTDTATIDAVIAASGWFLISGNSAAPTTPSVGSKLCLRRAVSRSGADLTFDSNLAFSGACSVRAVSSFPNQSAPYRTYGAAATSASATTGATAVVLTRPFVQVAGLVDGGALPSTVSGLGSTTAHAVSAGLVPFVQAGDACTLWNEQATTAATAVNAGTVNVGRTNLDQLAVVGANGIEIARFLAGGPTPVPTSGALTANLSTGIVTFTSVTGWSQPVTVRHRISQDFVVGSVVGHTVNLGTALARDFASGSVLSTHAPLGDVQATVGTMFAQQAWTRVFSDALIGGSVTLMYSGSPALTNQGAETERFAIVFTSGTDFTCYSEARGQIGSGTTAANFTPINPSTGVPYFTLLAASWSATILAGSVLRFNTVAAAPPLWVVRSTAPSAAAGTTKAALRLHGSANA